MIITFGNFKGGVGKTTTTALFSYLLSQNKDYKVLAVDTDPQSNLTETLALTFNADLDSEKNIFENCFSDDNNTSHYIQSLSDNLDILAGSWDMIGFEEKTFSIFTKDTWLYVLSDVVNSVADNYDFILIDTAPTTNLVMDNVLVLTDYILITTQTVPLAYQSTEKFYDYLLDMYSDDTTHFELIGVLPYLVGRSTTDERQLEKYTEIFGESLFKNHIRQSDRVKTWSDFGITTDKSYDKKTLGMYSDVVNEALERIENYETIK
jgi:cellulose biosynthesis protein BcsQ